MAGTLNVDTLKADSNLRLQIASANVAFIDVNGLTIVGNSLNVGGGRIAVTSNSAIINPTITTPTIAGNLNFDSTGTTGVRSPAANTLTFHTTGTEDMRINSVGGVQFNGSVSVGGATPTTSGAGITFPATQSASSDANTLDDYEEGTWTPVLSDGTNNVSTYYYQQGSYIKIGRQVYISCTISVFEKGSLSGSQIRVNGLPFTAASLNGVSWETYTFASKIFPTPANQYPIAEVNSTSTTVSLFSGSAGNQANIPASSVGGGSQIFFAGCYITS